MNYLLNASRNTEESDTDVIDIYLIAGQSNAAGSTHILCSQHSTNTACNTVEPSWDVMDELTAANSLYTSGFSNVLYSGTSGKNTVQGPTATLANIHSNGSMGPEVGMAESLSTYYNIESGRVAGIIKYAFGGTSLLDKENTTQEPNAGDRQADRGNWVSPSYEQYLIDSGVGIKHGDKTGELYDNLIAQVEASLQSYEKAGYTPVIKGLYWMQGEDDRIHNAEYKRAFTYFASDVRRDLAKLTGDDTLLEMPIIIGEISETFSNAVTQLTTNRNFIQTQHELAEGVPYCFIAYNSKYAITEKYVDDGSDGSRNVEGVFDAAHWNWQDCLSIGNDVGDIIKTYILGVTE